MPDTRSAPVHRTGEPGRFSVFSLWWFWGWWCWHECLSSFPRVTLLQTYSPISQYSKVFTDSLHTCVAVCRTAVAAHSSSILTMSTHSLLRLIIFWCVLTQLCCNPRKAGVQTDTWNKSVHFEKIHLERKFKICIGNKLNSLSFNVDTPPLWWHLWTVSHIYSNWSLDSSELEVSFRSGTHIHMDELREFDDQEPTMTLHMSCFHFMHTISEKRLEGHISTWINWFQY